MKIHWEDAMFAGFFLAGLVILAAMLKGLLW